MTSLTSQPDSSQVLLNSFSETLEKPFDSFNSWKENLAGSLIDSASDDVSVKLTFKPISNDIIA